jgi:bacillopeptidase F (M6 metalloprotease family)
VKTPILSTARIHTGANSLRAGATTASGTTEPSGDSSAYQSVTIPSNVTAATLTFWYSTYTTDTIQYDWQEARILDSSGNTLATIFKIAANNSAWTQQTFDLKAYAGRTIRIYFNCHGDGATDPTTLWVDDVSVKVTQ